MPDPVEHLIAAAGQIQRAACVDDIAAVLAQTLPGCEAATIGALHGCLNALQMSQAQTGAVSPEMASDLRIDTRRRLARLMGAHADAELATSLADLAVQAVSALAGAEHLPSESSGEPVAVAGLAGAVFVSMRARQYAEAHGLASAALDELLATTITPIRRACALQDAACIGELRYTHTHGALAASAILDTSTPGAPLIRIDLHEPGSAPREAANTAQAPNYAARLLRRLVG